MNQFDLKNLGDRIAALKWWEATELYEYLKHAGCQDELIPAHLKPYKSIFVHMTIHVPKDLNRGMIHGTPT